MNFLACIKLFKIGPKEHAKVILHVSICSRLNWNEGFTNILFKKYFILEWQKSVLWVEHGRPHFCMWSIYFKPWSQNDFFLQNRITLDDHFPSCELPVEQISHSNKDFCSHGFSKIPKKGFKADENYRKKSNHENNNEVCLTFKILENSKKESLKIFNRI